MPDVVIRNVASQFLGECPLWAGSGCKRDLALVDIGNAAFELNDIRRNRKTNHIDASRYTVATPDIPNSRQRTLYKLT